MISASKVTVTPALREQLCNRHLSTSCLSSREVIDGWFNTIYQLELADGRVVALKIAPDLGFATMRYERDILFTEVEVLKLLRRRGLAVPQVWAEGQGGETLGAPWFVMEWLPGEPLNKLRPRLTPRQQDEADGAVAWQTAAVHQITGTRFGRWRPDHTESSSWADSFSGMMDDLLADARDKAVDLPVCASEIRALLSSQRSVLDLVLEPKLVLWDLHDGNVMVDPETLRVTGFLDTDRALWGDPLMDFYFGDLADASPAWKAGYRDRLRVSGSSDPSWGRDADRRRKLYDLYLSLVMVIEVAYRGFNPGHDAWARENLAKALEPLL